MRKKLKILLKLPHLVLLSLSLYNFTLCCRFCCYFIFWQPVTFLLQHTFTKESSYGVVAIVLFFTKLFAISCNLNIILLFRQSHNRTHLLPPVTKYITAWQITQLSNYSVSFPLLIV